MNIKLSKVSFFLFVFFYNYIWFRIFIFPVIYNEYGNMSLLYCSLLIIISLLFFLLIPNKVYKYNFEDIYNNSKFKIIYNLILILESIAGIILVKYHINNFVSEINQTSLIFLVVLVIGLISNMKSTDLINMSTIFFIVCGLLILFSFIYFIPLDFTSFLHFEKKDTRIISMMSFILLDNLSFLLIDRCKFELSKPKLIIPIIFSLLFLVFELMFLLASAGEIYFNGVEGIGFIVMSIKPVAKYIGNFEFVYIIMLILTLVFKFGFNISIVKNSIKNKYIKTVLVFILLVGSLFCDFFMNYSLSSLLVFGLNISKIILVLWLVMEVYDVFKIKGK